MKKVKQMNAFNSDPVQGQDKKTVTWAEAFPDRKFRDMILALIRRTVGGITHEGVGEMTAEDMAALAKIVELDLSFESVRDLTGLEYLTGLKSFTCSGTPIACLDMSASPGLVFLDCSRCGLTELNLTRNTVLSNLYCGNNQLSVLDVSNCVALAILNCSYNKLTDLKVTQNAFLSYLNCQENQLTKLDVSKNSCLETLYCRDNPLESLDVSSNLNLYELYCDLEEVVGWPP